VTFGLPVARGQQPSYPIPRLYTVTPPGGKIGSTVEITVGGADLEEVAALYFSNPGLKADRVPDPDPKKAGQFVPNKFNITIAPTTPVGIYDVRAIGKWGISNPRAFAVGELNEVQEKEPNNDVSQAQKVELNTTVNGTIAPNVDVDYYSFAGKKGQRIVIHCASFSIDSRLDPEIRLFDAGGRLLAVNRRYLDRDAVVDCSLPADGDYLVRVCEYAYLAGSPEHYYRLTLSQGPWIDGAYPPVVEAGKPAQVTLYGRNLPNGQSDLKAVLDGRALDKLAVTVTPPTDPPSLRRLAFTGAVSPHTASLDGFEYRVKNAVATSNPVLLTYAAAPIVLDNEDNDTPEKAQAVPIPCEICGRIEKLHDRDWYAFTAKANDVFIIEGYADRLGSPMDLYFEVRRADNKQVLGEYDEYSEAFAPNNFPARTDDPKVRLQIPADGKYEIMVSSRDADVQAGPRHIYRLSIRKEQPDFQLVLVDNHGTFPGACTVRQGGSQHLEVLCFRRDGFTGEVTLTAEGLPQGVTCPAQVVGASMRHSSLVVTATADAPAWAGEIRIKGTAMVNGQPIEREARSGTVVWGLPPEQNIPTISRMGRSIVLAVREKGPFSLEHATKEAAVPVGGVVNVKVKVTRQPDMKQPIQLGPIPLAPNQLDLPPNLTFNNNNQPLPIPPDKNELDVQFQVKPNVPPGTYNLVVRGTAQVPFAKDPKAAQKPPVSVTETLPPIKLTVYNTVGEVSVNNPNVTIKPGMDVELMVKVNRLHGYAGEFKVQLVLPQGFAGVTAPEVTIPANAGEAKFVLKCPANAAPAANPNVIVRCVATIDKVTLNQDAKIAVTIAK
jgi:hypothetical protein